MNNANNIPRTEISKYSRDAEAAARARKATVAAQLEELQRCIAAVQASGADWGTVGSLGHVEEKLAELLAFLG